MFKIQEAISCIALVLLGTSFASGCITDTSTFCVGKENTDYADPCSLNCTGYVSCWAGRGYLRSCQSPLMFNLATKSCDFYYNVHCGTTLPPSPRSSPIPSPRLSPMPSPVPSPRPSPAVPSPRPSPASVPSPIPSPASSPRPTRSPTPSPSPLRSPIPSPIPSPSPSPIQSPYPSPTSSPSSLCPTNLQTFCIGKPNKLFADSCDTTCNAYINCGDGIGYRQTCPQATPLFNPKGYCDSPGSFVCNPPSPPPSPIRPPLPPLPPSSPPSPPSPPPAAWEGWATTTFFGAGETEWPSGVPNAENLMSINNASSLPHPTIGAAIPWRYYFKRYGGRSQLLQAVYNAWSLKNSSEKVCFEVQPINVTPAQLAQGSYDLPSLQQSGKTVYDINSNLVAALDAEGNQYPVYQIVPYEGCGGNCKAKGAPTSDCFNDCYATLDAAGVTEILNGDFSDATNDVCMGMNTLWSGGAWPNTPATQSAFSKYSANTAINLENGSWQQQTTENYLNWCSGFNLHFDVALPNPYWADITPSAHAPPSARVAGDTGNILVRYRATTCKPW